MFIIFIFIERIKIKFKNEEKKNNISKRIIKL